MAELFKDANEEAFVGGFEDNISMSESAPVPKVLFAFAALPILTHGR